MTPSLPAILAGPLLRHCRPDCFTLWLVTSETVSVRLQLFLRGGQRLLDKCLEVPEHHRVPLGGRCHINFIHLSLPHPLPENEIIEYELLLNDEPSRLAERLPHLCYPGESRPNFVLKQQLDNLLHGSCRKAHHSGPDTLLRADRLLSGARTRPEDRPALLMFTGDQVYADDVGGPMLVAVHQVMDKLGLFGESFEGATVTDSQDLLTSPHCYYERPSLLPKNKANAALLDVFFGGARKPIFTSAGAQNHLISLAEVIALYLLYWSPACWQWVNMAAGLERVPARYRERYREEMHSLEAFAEGLPRVQRLMAQLPVYMIFDDHDITDDWNLTRGWEEAAYGHPFSRRIIGNALIGYWLCQGWGNQPDLFEPLAEQIPNYFGPEGLTNQDQLIDRLLDWDHWHYQLDTQPPLVVLDTRTHRWRSESSPSRPSGLMDWESLSDLQQQLIKQEAVIMVSPSPIFGVKLVEAVQRVFTFFGKALLVDAENWMAHPGAANVILNIFRHPKTPPNFIILSGDVHYSFAYEVTLRHRVHSPRILQVTSSGIKNSFPEKLLKWFDRINQWLYGAHSPLNFFTKRRRMQIMRRQPSHNPKAVLYNNTNLGQLLLSEEFEQIEVRVLSENETVYFK